VSRGRSAGWSHGRAGALVTLVLVGAAGCTDTGVEPDTWPSGPPTVVAVGDLVSCSEVEDCLTADTAGLASSLDPDALLTLGDLQYPSGELADFETEYDQVWGPLRPVTRPVPGNHEYYTDGAAGYFDYFDAAAHEDSDGYYSFDVGSWHLVALNTNDECERVACDDGSAQQQWFAADLVSSDAACTLAYWHHPRWSTGEHLDTEEVDALWRTAAAGGVDLVLNGHDHDYERYAAQDGLGEPDPAGITEMVVGTGGGELREFVAAESPLTQVRISGRIGVLRLLLAESYYRWEFVAVGGDVLDAGRADCT